MPRVAILTVCTLAATWLALAASATARDLSGVPPEVRSGPTVLSSEGRFLVHHAAGGRHAISSTRAHELARLAEKAWRIEVGNWGWPAPLSDGSGPLDVYVHDMPAAGRVTSDRASGPSSSWMEVHPDYVDPVLVAHEFLHMSQHAIAADYQGQVLTEGLGHWAGYAAADSHQPADWAQSDPTLPFGCVGWLSCVVGKWPLFQFLAERYGHRLLVDAYRRAAAMGGDPEQRAVPAIDAALRARGQALGDAFSAYTAAVTRGDFQLDALQAQRPRPAVRMRFRGCTGKRRTTLPIDRLTARWVELESYCLAREATLRVSLTWPAALPAVRPEIVAEADVHGLRVRRRPGRLTATIPASALMHDLSLGLPNSSLTEDGQPFAVQVRSTARRLARVRILSAPRVRRGSLSLRLRSSRGVVLGVGLARLARAATRETVVLARVPRGASTLRVPIPVRLERGRYAVSVRGGLMIGRSAGLVRLGRAG